MRRVVPLGETQTRAKVEKYRKQRIRTNVGAYTGHCNRRVHVNTLRLTTVNTCRGCVVEEKTFEHFLRHCIYFYFKNHIMYGTPNCVFVKEI